MKGMENGRREQEKEKSIQMMKMERREYQAKKKGKKGWNERKRRQE